MPKLGTTALQQQPISYWRDESGPALSYAYESTDANVLLAYAQTLSAMGVAYRVTNSHGKGRIEIIQQSHELIGGDPPTIANDSRWELMSRTVEKDILEAGNPLTITVPKAELWLIKKIIAENSLGDYVDDTGTLDPPNGITSASGLRLFKYLTDGVKSTPIEQPVLKHTLSVSAQYITPATYANVGRIISTATLIATEGIPAAILFDLPDDADPAPVEVGGTGVYQVLLYGWLKKAPEVMQIARRKWQLVQQWEYGLYGIEMYPGQARL